MSISKALKPNKREFEVLKTWLDEGIAANVPETKRFPQGVEMFIWENKEDLVNLCDKGGDRDKFTEWIEHLLSLQHKITPSRVSQPHHLTFVHLLTPCFRILQGSTSDTALTKTSHEPVAMHQSLFPRWCQLSQFWSYTLFTARSFDFYSSLSSQRRSRWYLPFSLQRRRWKCSHQQQRECFPQSYCRITKLPSRFAAVEVVFIGTSDTGKKGA